MVKGHLYPLIALGSVLLASLYLFKFFRVTDTVRNERVMLASRKPQLLQGPFTRGPASYLNKLCTENSPWSQGWGPGCGTSRVDAHAIHKILRTVSHRYPTVLFRNLDDQIVTTGLRSRKARFRFRRLTTLADGSSEALGNEEPSGNLPPAIVHQPRSWGKWRTPGNSNAFPGMRQPIPNNNPFGNNVIFRESDNDVNISKIESSWYNPLFDSFQYGLPKVFYEDDISVPCAEETVDCSPIKVSFPVSQIHTPSSSIAGWRPTPPANKTADGYDRSTNKTGDGKDDVTSVDLRNSSDSDSTNNAARNSSRTNTPPRPSDDDFSWPSFRLDWPWPKFAKPSYPRDSLPLGGGDTIKHPDNHPLDREVPADQPGFAYPRSPIFSDSLPPYGDDLFVPAQPIVARRPPHMTDRKMDPLDKALTSRTYTTSQLESVSRAAMLRLSHTPSQPSGAVGGHRLPWTGSLRWRPTERARAQPGSRTLRAEPLPRGKPHPRPLRRAKPGPAGAAGHAPQMAGRGAPGGLGAWNAGVSHELAAVRQALNEPPQRLVQAALDRWIAADVHRP